jgi:two-component system alkaline phosphatase synthesis response regulator PhoP
VQVVEQPIVIVEDDENIAQMLGYLFRRAGFAPLVIRDGRAAEDHVASHAPAAAVLLDVMLPYRDGFQVATAIRADARWQGVPIVMLTSRALPADQERARGLGVAAYVTKPFHPRTLVGRVRKLLGAAGAR